VTVYPRIRQDLAAIGHGGYAVELVDRLLPDGASVPRLFRLLVSYLEHLDQGGASLSGRRFFETNLLNILGYRLSLDACAACGVELPADAARRAGAAGTVLCTGCGRYGAPLSAETVRLLQRCLGTGRFGTVVFPPEALGEAGPLLDDAIGAHLTRPLNSLAFLRQLTP